MTFDAILLGFKMFQQHEVNLVNCTKVLEGLKTYLDKAKLVPNPLIDATWKFVLKMSHARNFEITEDCLTSLKKFPGTQGVVLDVIYEFYCYAG